MIRSKHLFPATSVVLLTCVAIGVGVTTSSAQEDPPPIEVWLLTPRSVFTDDVTAQLRVKLDDGTRVLNVRDPSPVAVAEIAIQPGAQFPWHTHLGPVIATVAEGELST